jgi:predicted CopG family antitoxin
MPYRSGVTTIQLSPDTREKLKELGKKGETYEEIILRLIKTNKK